jgi:hypothetical protein
MPWLSNHYGLTGTTRFTNQLTPLILVAWGAGRGVWKSAISSAFSPTGRRRQSCAGRGIGEMTVIAAALLVSLSLWPLTSLAHYYDHAVARGETNAPTCLL